ncbi:hypothetical protein EJ02DRAFT_16558 [Clathrospora elynae]|uniref:Uncharacterized protein n=1 Tax=Clathrospora elynae TaxID=706981 RepID=A0A6A5SFU4_9PLEO|nr:hypothetical protein EJ02DRAFT_16558 [Clathrospora elynae]
MSFCKKVSLPAIEGCTRWTPCFGLHNLTLYRFDLPSTPAKAVCFRLVQHLRVVPLAGRRVPSRDPVAGGVPLRVNASQRLQMSLEPPRRAWRPPRCHCCVDAAPSGVAHCCGIAPPGVERVSPSHAACLGR